MVRDLCMSATLFATNATSIFIEIGAAAMWLLGIIAALVGVIGWLLKRELARAQVVEADMKQLLAGNAPWVKGMSLEIANLRAEIYKLYGLLARPGQSESDD